MVIAGEWLPGRTLGSGATATVSLATYLPSGMIFAVKSSSITSSVLLQREHSILSSLCSPHIVSCLGAGVSQDSYHLFLELATGGTLSDHTGRVEDAEIRSFTHQILLALRYLHSNGVAHCDVKGRNVLLFSDGQVKLADFGSARRVKDANVPVMCTPAFMAPEVARGEEQGFAGDIWSLGCTVLEMATGKSPWKEVPDQIAAIHRIGFSADVPSVPEWISEEGRDFLSRCLVRDPKQRWTAEELLRHPFVVEEESPVCAYSSEKQGRWVSPKRTLQYGLWDSETEEDDEEGLVDQPPSLSERIRRLASPSAANWSWSESWLICRSSEVEESFAVVTVDERRGRRFGSSVNSDVGELVSTTWVGVAEHVLSPRRGGYNGKVKTELTTPIAYILWPISSFLKFFF